VNVHQALPETPVLQAGASTDTETQSGASVETEDAELSLLEHLGLTLGLDIHQDE
jgi:hypothetical protein